VTPIHVLLLEMIMAFEKPDDIIKVGTITPLTGVVALDGNELANGIKLAEKEINECGGLGVGGKRLKLEVVYGDDQGRPEATRSVLMRMIESDRINVAVGHLKSAGFLAVMDLYERYRIPVIDVAAAAESIYERIAAEKLKYVFQASPAGVDITNALLEPLGYWFKPKKIAVCAENQEGGKQTGEHVRDWASKNDVEMVTEEYVPLEETNLIPALSTIKASGAEAIVVHLNGEGPNASLFETLCSLKVPAVVSHIGITVTSKDFRKKYATTLEGSIAVTRFVWGKMYTSKTNSFYNRYQAMFGHPPIQWCIQAYDSLYVMADAIQRAGSLNPGAIAKALEESHYAGAWKKDWSFEPRTHRSRASLAVSQFQGGELIPIWPLDIAEKFKQVPPYAWQKTESC